MTIGSMTHHVILKNYENMIWFLKPSIIHKQKQTCPNQKRMRNSCLNHVCRNITRRQVTGPKTTTSHNITSHNITSHHIISLNLQDATKHQKEAAGYFEHKVQIQYTCSSCHDHCILRNFLVRSLSFSTNGYYSNSQILFLSSLYMRQNRFAR